MVNRTGNTAAVLINDAPENIQIFCKSNKLGVFLNASLWLSSAGLVAMSWFFLFYLKGERHAEIGLCTKIPSFFSDKTGCEQEASVINAQDILANTTAGWKWYQAYNTDGAVIFSGLQECVRKFQENRCGVLSWNYNSFEFISNALWDLVGKCDPLSTRDMVFVVCAIAGTVMLGIAVLAKLTMWSLTCCRTQDAAPIPATPLLQ